MFTFLSLHPRQLSSVHVCGSKVHLGSENCFFFVRFVFCWRIKTQITGLWAYEYIKFFYLISSIRKYLQDVGPNNYTNNYFNVQFGNIYIYICITLFEIFLNLVAFYSYLWEGYNKQTFVTRMCFVFHTPSQPHKQKQKQPEWNTPAWYSVPYGRNHSLLFACWGPRPGCPILRRGFDARGTCQSPGGSTDQDCRCWWGLTIRLSHSIWPQSSDKKKLHSTAPKWWADVVMCYYLWIPECSLGFREPSPHRGLLWSYLHHVLWCFWCCSLITMIADYYSLLNLRPKSPNYRISL